MYHHLEIVFLVLNYTNLLVVVSFEVLDGPNISFVVQFDLFFYSSI